MTTTTTALPAPDPPPLPTEIDLTSTSSHLNLAALISPAFSPSSHANTLVLSTNNPSDATIDLTTPLSRALFDAQEIDSLIHSLTSRHALEILTYSKTQTEAAGRVLDGLEGGLARLNEGHGRLEREVLGRYERAERLSRAAERGVGVVRLLRDVQRVLGAARQLEGYLAETGMGLQGTKEGTTGSSMVQAARAVLLFRSIMAGGPQGSALGRVQLVKSVRGRIMEDGEEKVRDWARKVIREFNIGSLISTAVSVAGPNVRDAEEARTRFVSACHVLYLLSPTPRIEGRDMKREEFEPELLLRALQAYVQTAVQSSAGGIARGLAALPQLDRALSEASSRCQSVVGMERVLGQIHVPEHPMLDVADSDSAAGDGDDDDDDDDDDENGNIEKHKANLLQPLLHALDTASLPSYFWRSLAGQLGPRVQEIVSRGGVSARTLKSNRDKVRDEIRECVLRGSRVPTGGAEVAPTEVGSWEREAAVMAGSVMGPLGR